MATTVSKATSGRPELGGFPVTMDSSPSLDTGFPEHMARDLVRWFKLLADETRLRILLFLVERSELNVRALCDLLQLSQPAVSHHLALLRVEGLIECRRDGKHNYYRVLPDRLRALAGMIGSLAAPLAHPPT